MKRYEKFAELMAECNVDKGDWVCSPGAEEAAITFNNPAGQDKIYKIIEKFSFQVRTIVFNFNEGIRITGGLWTGQYHCPAVDLTKEPEGQAAILRSNVDLLLSSKTGKFITIINDDTSNQKCVVWRIWPSVPSN